ncbi:hypothetical protein FCIRC_6393 [Fusarium circinatum]|uniref:Uncharacterized protein n=1 Tax=Fusarium circinatum TaxID=48490 RepID=A0A8H5U0E0_FUSCI|nr:hypothetical protein FCIRC_6393 [Fusarium circinatum]
MAPPHHQTNRNHRDYGNRSRSYTSRAQTGGSQNEDVAAAQRAVDEAMERQRQAQRAVDEAMKWQREVQREVDEAIKRQQEVQREVARRENRADSGAHSQRSLHPSLASNRNTSVARNGNQSSFRQASRPTGITKPQQPSSVGPSDLVPEAERRDFVDTRHMPGGVIVVSKSLSSGEQRRSYHFPPNRTGSMEGVTYDMDELKAAGEHVQRTTGCNRISFRVEARKNDAKSFIENEDVVMRVISSDRRTRGQVEALGEPSRATEISRQPGTECVNCRSKTHTLRHCLDTEGDGEMPGCVLCNKMTHAVDECRGFQRMSLKEQVELLVFERANMPRLKVSEDFPMWYELLEQGIASGAIDANGVMEGFPWSSPFCEDLTWEDRGDRVRDLQKHFDDSGFDTSKLPADPNTATLEQVRSYYPGQSQTSAAPGPSSSG